jgi:serine/threonine-protein kinase
MADSSSNPDRNLLFGVLAVRLNFIGLDRLVTAVHARAADESRPLGQVLVDRGDLSPDRRDFLEAVVEEHLSANAVGATTTLPAGSPAQEDRAAWLPLSDPDLFRCRAAGPADGARFRVLRPHARGGLGDVFVAEDTELHRHVALKEIQPRHAENPASRERFLTEAEITGGLEHPGIVPVYGLGTSADGRPFYAMRFIKGETLMEAAARFHAAPADFAGVEFRQLARRFLDVCDTIAYAHSRGVLHRDLKPGNVMLGPYGETLVVDWGLAKPLGRPEPAAVEGDVEPALRPTAGCGSVTQTGQAVGTPGFMSPEQAEGRLDQLGPASDVYSLGATLYVLLTGKAPFAGEVPAVLAQVRAGSFPPPRQVNPRVPRPLDAVCRKAMALRPEDRYPTAQALAAELEHWLADEPVAACREPAVARAARWGRRHKPLVAAAAALLIATAAGLAATLWAVDRERDRTAKERDKKVIALEVASRQRDLADANFAQARQAVEDYFNTVSESKLLHSPLPGLQPLRRDLLESALRYYQKFVEEHRDDPALRAELARAYYRVGRITADIGTQKDAQQAYRSGLDLYRELSDTRPDDPEVARGRADCAAKLGYLLVTVGAAHKDESLALLTEAREIYERLAAEPAAPVGVKSGLAGCYTALSLWANRHSRPADEAVYLARAMAIYHDLAGADPRFRLSLATATINLGYYHTRYQGADKALAHFNLARQVLEKLIAEQPNDNDLEARSELRRAHTNIGYVHQLHTRKLDLAVTHFAEAKRIAEQLARENPAVAKYYGEWSGMCDHLAEVHLEANRVEQAALEADESLAALQSALKIDPENSRYKYKHAGVLSTQAEIRLIQKKLPEALDAATKGRAVIEPLVRAEKDHNLYPALLLRILQTTGSIHEAAGRPAEALAAYREATAVLELRAARPDCPANDLAHLAGAHQKIGELHARAGRPAEAAPAYERAFALRSRVVAVRRDSNRSGDALAEVGLALADLWAAARPDDARATLQTCRAALLALPRRSAADELRRAEVTAALARLTPDTPALADEAMAALQAAHAAGPLDPAALTANPRFAALKGRDDFRGLLREPDPKDKSGETRR